MHHPKRSASFFQIQLSKTEPLIQYLSTTSLHIVPVHGTVDKRFFFKLSATSFPWHIYFAK